jgi:serine/threonine protein kinase
MLFTASLSKLSSESIPVFVKLVNGRYGEEVHKLLADHGLAPVLYGVSDLEGAPKAYVMEYLDPSSWMTLSAYLALPDTFTHAESIRFSINKVLEVLQKNRKVHGDLRAPNILVNVSLTGQLILVEDDSGIRRANIKVVDFDWAGDADKVYYPPSRNPDLTWPGEPGGFIENGHDQKLVDSWWVF